MKKHIIVSLFSSLLLSLVVYNLSFGEEDKKNPAMKKLSKADRSEVHQIMEIYGADITKALNSPDKMIIEPLLIAVEKRNKIEINRKSMMKTNLCIANLMRSASHLSKISTGNKVIKAKVEIDSESRKTSMYTRWNKRNLEGTSLKFKLFYDNETVSPTDFVCSGYGYY